MDHLLEYRSWKHWYVVLKQNLNRKSAKKSAILTPKDWDSYCTTIIGTLLVFWGFRRRVWTTSTQLAYNLLWSLLTLSCRQIITNQCLLMWSTTGVFKSTRWEWNWEKVRKIRTGALAGFNIRSLCQENERKWLLHRLLQLKSQRNILSLTSKVEPSVTLPF